MNEPRVCPSCGVAIVPSRAGLAGLCPACAWKGLWGDDPDAEGGPERAEGLLMRVPGYEIKEEIARGGMGIVYRARQLHPPRMVALKMLLPYQLGSPEMAERFRLEVRALTELEHPAILPVYQVGEHERLPFFTMKLAAGGTLAQRRHSFAGRWREIAELMAGLAEAVQFAHDRGVLHRDLKPGNILFDEKDRAYVSDFGLAKLVSADSELTQSIEVLGTPHYVAPEVAAGSARQATIASDIYSLGAILYELLAGRPPFEAEGIPALLRKVAEDEPAPLQGVPRDLEVICRKCLAKLPGTRYATARELGNDLRRWLDGRTIIARPATRLERVRTWTRRNPALAIMASLILLILGCAVWLQTQAKRQLEQSLRESLLTQARLQRGSGRAGQRFETLAMVGRAVQLEGSPETRAALRTEVAGALALPDVRPLARWPVQVAHLENIFHFSGDLESYVATMPDGGFAVFSTRDRRSMWQFAGVSNNPVVTLRLSPDAAWVAAQFQDGHSEVHSVKGVAPVQRWRGRLSPKSQFQFSATGDRFAIAEPGGPTGHMVEVRSVPDFDLQASIVLSAPANAMAFDQSGKRVAVASTELSIWEIEGTNRSWSAGLENGASAAAWSSDGQWIAVALDRRVPGKAGVRVETAGQPTPEEINPVWLFDARSGARKALFTETFGRVEQLSFHPDGQSLALAHWDGELMWGALQPHGFRLMTEAMQRALCFSSDGKRLAYSPTRDELGLMELAQPEVLKDWAPVSQRAKRSYGMAVSGDGRWVVTGTDSRIHLWDAEAREEVDSRKLPGAHWWLTVLFGPGDEFLYYGAASFGVHQVELVRSQSTNGRPQVRFGTDRMIGPGREFTPLGFASDGRSLIVGQNRRTSANDRIPPTVWHWPDGDAEHARKLTENHPLVGYRAVSGHWAVSADLISPDLTIWNINTGERVRNLGIELPVTCEIAPNGRWVITRTRDEFAVWEVGSWRQLSRWPVESDEQSPSWIVASPDSRVVISQTTGGLLVVRRLPSGEKLLSLPAPRSGQIQAFCYHPSGTRVMLLLANGQVYEWHWQELREELARLDLDWDD